MIFKKKVEPEYVAYTYKDNKGHSIMVCEIPKKEEPKPYFFKDLGYDNAAVKWHNKVMRYRGECLVFKNEFKEVYICKSKDSDEGGYYTPGGGAEPHNDLMSQVLEECKEEAAMVVKDIQHSGLQYLRLFNGNYPQWHKDTIHKRGIVYDGYYSEMYWGVYESQITEEVKNKKDIDDYMRKNGKFITISENIDFLKPEHKFLIQRVWKLNSIKNDVDLKI